MIYNETDERRWEGKHLCNRSKNTLFIINIHRHKYLSVELHKMKKTYVFRINNKKTCACLFIKKNNEYTYK